MNNRLTLWRRAALITLTLMVGAMIVQFGLLLPSVGAGGVLVDFDAFYIAGDLVRQGRAAEAYDLARMAAIQRDLAGTESFMPWTYPPQYDLAVAALPSLTRGTAFIAFGLITWGLFVTTVALLARQHTLWVLLAVLPPVYVTATIGQNAFLSAALIGLTALGLRRGRGWAGVPLGLMVIKPHLAITLGVFTLFARRWRVMGLALALVLVTSAAATWVLTPAIWPAFLGAVDQAGQALATGFFPLFRMTSGYALAQTLGAPPAIASAVQAGFALTALAATALATLRLSPRHALATALFAAPLISPYVYDYDMVITAIALALVAPDIAARTGWVERLLLLVALWIAGGWAMVQAISNAHLPWQERAAIAQNTVAYGAAAYLIALAMIARVLTRAPR